MSSIRVVTDSTADIPAPVAEELGIAVVPCYVHFGTQTYLDGVNLARQEFFARLASGAKPPTTSQPPVGAFAAVYQRLAGETKEIISIHSASKLSALCDAARLGAEMVPDVKVALIDSAQASMGTGWLAVLAARAARIGQSLDATVAMIRDTVPRVRLWAVIDDLHFLQRSGRVHWVDALLGSLLNIKPVVVLKEGEVHLLERIRTKTKALERLVAVATACGPLQEVAAVHANAPQDAEIAVNLLVDGLASEQRALPGTDSRARILVAEAGAVMTTHAGPGAVALACVLAKI